MITPTIKRTAFVLLLLMTVALMAVPAAKGVVLGLMIVYALRGPRQTIEALMVGIFLTLSNQEMGTGYAALRWPLLFAGFGRVVWEMVQRKQLPDRGGSLLLIGMCALSAIVLALFVSAYPSVSVLKAVAFFLGTFTILGAFSLTRDQPEHWYSWFATFFAYAVWASVLFYVQGSSLLAGLFKGVFNQPQAFGGFLIPMTAWAAVVCLRSRPMPWGFVATTMLAFFWIYTTGSRTSMLATLLAVTTTVGVGLLRSGVWREPIVSGLRKFALPALLLMLVASVLAGPQIMAGVEAFMAKDDANQPGLSVGAAFEDSRGFLIDKQMANFRASPITGIGLGVPSNQEGDFSIKTGFLGLPMGASVEKGFLPSAVLEEMGLVGATLLLLIFGSLLRLGWQQPDPALFALLSGALLINAGEMIFFSPTALGAFMWLSVGFATTQFAPVSQRYAHRVVYRKPTAVRYVAQAT